MNEQMLEILIGKYLDSEITPAEQKMLNEEVEKNPEAKELLEQFQAVNNNITDALQKETQHGSTAEDIFERAAASRTATAGRVTRFLGGFRFAAGLAAGLLIGIGIHLMLPANMENRGTPLDHKTIAGNPDAVSNEKAALKTPVTEDRIDWYHFPDDNGGEWIIEGRQKSRVIPAMYYEDL